MVEHIPRLEAPGKLVIYGGQLETQPGLREAKGLGDTGSIFVKGQCGYANTPVGVERFD